MRQTTNPPEPSVGEGSKESGSLPRDDAVLNVEAEVRALGTVVLILFALPNGAGSGIVIRDIKALDRAAP